MLGQDTFGLILDFVSQDKYMEILIPSLRFGEEAAILPLHD